MKASHFAIIFLSFIIFSSGIASSFAQQLQCGRDQVIQGGQCVDAFDDTPMSSIPITASTDRETYSAGNTITVSGTVSEVDLELKGAITFTVKSPAKNIVAVGQDMPASDGTFSTTFKAAGQKWNADGDYEITIKYGADENVVSFNFQAGSAAPPTCPPGSSLVGNTCVVDEPDPDPIPVPEPTPTTPDPEIPAPAVCGPGTQLDENGICQLVPTEPDKPAPAPTEPKPVEPTPTEPESPDDRDNGCLIATAAYGSELAPQVQLLREIRDHTLYNTASGTSFMTAFNQVYYLFSPTVADWERESPIFKELVRAAITPMLASLEIMTLADSSEGQVLGYGISVIALNLGMYIVAPAGAIIGIRRYAQTKSAQ